MQTLQIKCDYRSNATPALFSSPAVQGEKNNMRCIEFCRFSECVPYLLPTIYLETRFAEL